MDTLNTARRAGVLAADKDTGLELHKVAAGPWLPDMGVAAKILGTMVALPVLASAYLGYTTKRTIQSPDTDKEFEHDRLITKLLADANLQQTLRNDALAAQLGRGTIK